MAEVSERVKELVEFYGRDDVSVADVLCDRHDPTLIAFTLVDRDFAVTDLTYGELRERSEHVAAGLTALGVRKGDRVATLMGKSPEYLATVLGIWRLGAVHVPLFTAFATPAITFRLEGSGANVVVTDARQRPKLIFSADASEKRWQIVNLRTGSASRLVPGDIDFEELNQPRASTPPIAIQGGRGAMVQIYTSGTTGRPKGVALPVFAMATWHLYLELGLHVTEEDIFWCAADPGWAYGLYAGVVAPLAAGRRSILHEDKFSPEATWRIMADREVTNFTAAPTVYRALRTSTPLPVTLQKASSAGEPLTPEINEWAPTQLGVHVHDHYGQTEAGMVFCNHHHPDLATTVEPGSMGLPLPGWEAAILKDGTDSPADAGEIGRVAIDTRRSPVSWFTGYVDAPEATATKFTADRRWYLTGDTGRRGETGHFFFSARQDDVIIMAGYRIGPFDVESIIATHPAVAECAVVAVPDQMKGEVIEAFVSLKADVDDQEGLGEELKQRVRDNLGRHAYPRRIFVIDELPKTPSGKIQRYVLRERRRTELQATTTKQ